MQAAQAITLTRPIPPPKRVEGEPGSQGKPRVLVIDDLPEARELCCAFLAFRGFGVSSAADGQQGLAAARATGPDAIVLDYSMPIMDGEEVICHLKADARTRAIPVVMLTAMPDLVDTLVRAACTAVLEKPCDPDTLVSTIAAALVDRTR